MKRKLLTTALATMCFMAVGAQPKRLLGGDISLLPTYEARGTQFRTPQGEAKPLLPLLRDDAGWNAARVRIFVEPDKAPGENKDEGVCQDLPYVTRLCQQIRDAGLQLMLDFHYSDTWADPGKQFIPARWQHATPQALADSIYSYTTGVLSHLRHNGVVPQQIQVGNEITFGTLWPAGRIDPLSDDNWDALSAMLRSGVKACREQCPEAKVIIHTEKAGQWPMTKGYYERLKKYGVDYDIIGLSYYPMWHGTVSNLSLTLDSIETCFPDKRVMIVETAFYYSHDNDPWVTDSQQHSELYPITPEGQAQFTRELVSVVRRHDNVDGLYWWFPEENESGEKVIQSWINRGLFDNHTGRALPALYALRSFLK